MSIRIIRISVVALILLILLHLTCPVSTALVLHVEDSDEKLDPVPDRPQWAEIPQNVTIEYGTRFYIQYNITGGTAAAWAISDDQRFTISWSWGYTFAYVEDNDVLPIGEYFLRIYVWDQDYSGISADIWISVVDSHSPTITGPADIEYIQGSNRSLSFFWSGFDLNPLYYLITLNGGLVAQGDWTEQEFEFEVAIGHLRKGSYGYTLTLWDLGNNSSTDTVTVHVTSDGSEPTTRSSHDYLVGRNTEKFEYIDAPDVLFIEIFAIIVLSGLIGLVSITAMTGKGYEFGFN